VGSVAPVLSSGRHLVDHVPQEQQAPVADPGQPRSCLSVASRRHANELTQAAAVSDHRVMSMPAVEWPEAEQRIAEVARTHRGRHRDRALASAGAS
jgi:hypothetical protein